jgi:hypothetical protein
MIHGERELTTGGNPRPPSMDIYLQWIVNAWAELKPETIEKSFKVCGITNANDGSEDELIHFLKSSDTGRALLKEGRAAKNQSAIRNDENNEDVPEEDFAYDSDNSIEIEF